MGRYTVRAFRDWGPDEPTVSTHSTLDEAERYARSLPHPLIDIIDRTDPCRVAVVDARRMLAHPAAPTMALRDLRGAA